ncbi:MAG: 50S ribosomal protein L18e [Candidatus Woesearchaeota archaeon]|nr:MAG: 50S ribosomal protein L18e [Candidatus Woesearchaeota archaeon]
MVRKTKATNPILKKLIQDLIKQSNKNKAPVWKRVAKDLSKPARQRRSVNLARINKYSKANDTIIVPGKVLGTGELDHKVTVAAFDFSEAAKKKIDNAISIQELMKKNPKGSKVKLIG